MSTLSANTLFHFTRNKETLISILKTKFYPRLCNEDLVLIGTIAKLASPMVCFCDIPLSQIANHVKTYGKYAIGLKKDWAIKRGITPVLYTHPKSLLCDNFKEQWAHISKNKQSEERNDFFLDFIYTSLFIKPYIGSQVRNGKKEKIIFYNEREWRYIPPKKALYIDEQKKYLGLLFEDFLKKTNIEELNTKYETYGIEFTPNDINYIIVEKEDEILEIIDAVQRIKGKYPFEEVKLLSTRIISMERISEDF